MQLNGRWKGGRVYDDDGYVLIKMPTHPFADKQGYVREHRLVVEAELGRFLEPREVVHHINHVKDDNRPENLQLLPSHSEHARLERIGYKHTAETRGQNVRVCFAAGTRHEGKVVLVVFIVPEIGVNWNNSMVQAQELIDAAKTAGADAVKFQFYNATQLLGPGGDAPAPPEIFEQVTWMDDVGWKEAKALKQLCDDADIEFFASAFDERRLIWLEELGVKRHKLASRSVKFQPEYCAKVLALGKPVIASLGMWDYRPSGKERPFSWNPLTKDYRTAGRIFGAAQVEYLYCQAVYPAPLEHVRMPGEFRSPDMAGYSDHTQGISAALMAVARGATIIEKHFTLSHDLPGPDHICSATPEEFTEMVSIIRDMEKMR